MTTTKLVVMPEDIDWFAEICRHEQENNIQTYQFLKFIFPSVDGNSLQVYVVKIKTADA